MQAAYFAEQANASPQLISACLLHDEGPLLHDLPEDAPDQEELSGVRHCFRFTKVIHQASILRGISCGLANSREIRRADNRDDNQVDQTTRKRKKQIPNKN